MIAPLYYHITTVINAAASVTAIIIAIWRRLCIFPSLYMPPPKLSAVFSVMITFTIAAVPHYDDIGRRRDRQHNSRDYRIVQLHTTTKNAVYSPPPSLPVVLLLIVELFITMLVREHGCHHQSYRYHY